MMAHPLLFKLTIILLLAVASLRVLGQEQAKAQDDATVHAADGTKDAMPSGYRYGGREGHDDHQPFYDTLYPGSSSCACPGCPLPLPPPRTLCGCSCPLSFATLNTTNGCTAGCPGSGGGGFCQTQFCTGCNTGAFEFCIGFKNATGVGGGGGDLCYEATCPQDGVIRIEGRAGAVSCCGGQGPIYIFNGTYTPGNFGNLLAQSSGITNAEGPVDATVACKAGQKFSLCEVNSVLLTAYTKFTFSRVYQDACPQGCTQIGSCSATPNFVNALA